MSEPSDESMILTRSKAIKFIFDNSLLLLAGTAAAVVWANLDVASYDGVAHPLHFWVNHVGMVFFFALAAKEVFEATLPGGSLASPRRALSPLAAAVGGMVAPALIYVALASTRGPDELIRGVGSCSWSTVCARRFSRTLAVSWGGPFFGDYFRSVRMPQTRDDGDSGGVSYVGNPIHGAASGFIWLDHEDGAHDRGWASRRSTGRVAPARQRGQPCTAFDRVRPADAKHRSATLGCGRTPRVGPMWLRQLALSA
jgi:hypothetical protein